jgi:hypothetical protein
MAEEPQEYLSYLLRLWRASLHGKPTWRASLESAQTGERRSFADLESLFAFFKARCTADATDPLEP